MNFWEEGVMRKFLVLTLISRCLFDKKGMQFVNRFGSSKYGKHIF